MSQVIDRQTMRALVALKLAALDVVRNAPDPADMGNIDHDPEDVSALDNLIHSLQHPAIQALTAAEQGRLAI